MSFCRSPSIPAGAGTVISVSVVDANGVSGSVATDDTTPAITLALGDITPDSVTIADSGTLAIISPDSAFKSILASPGSLAADVTITLPETDGDISQVLTNVDGLGKLGWSDPGISSASVVSLLSVLNGKQVADLIGTSDVTLSGVQTLDGASTSGASIVLLAGQTDPTENGMWLVDDFLPWTRPTGWSGGIERVPGSLVSITSNSGGVTYSNTLWFGTGDGSTTAVYQRVAVGVAGNTGWGSITNVTLDKAYNANATTVDELADVLGTLIAQLITQGILRA